MGTLTPRTPSRATPRPFVCSKAQLAELLSRATAANLDASATLTLVALWTYTDTEGRCWPSQATLARRAGLSERSVRSGVRALERARILYRDVPPPRARSLRKVTVYKVPLPGARPWAPPATAAGAPSAPAAAPPPPAPRVEPAPVPPATERPRAPATVAAKGPREVPTGAREASELRAAARVSRGRSRGVRPAVAALAATLAGGETAAGPTRPLEAREGPAAGVGAAAPSTAPGGRPEERERPPGPGPATVRPAAPALTALRTWRAANPRKV